ncbi:MAG: 16S rRNA (guanine(966)-N(2))-methyltransferase RsmD [Veillonellaceae bacterium]|nr:16S rRNA (guanine(966)-N(2))-methyltransferase RsmD [Veillonellaceae bacterium]
MRIIAGLAKGHTIKAPKGQSTRPTLDRVRESVFNVLSNWGLYKVSVLDLFSGTGAFALEALSRGASQAISVDKRTKKLIKENAIHCHLEDKIDILSMMIPQVGAKLAEQTFDYIFSDPPYEKGLIQETIQMVDTYHLLKPTGYLILERHEREEYSLPDTMECIRTQSFGYTRVDYCRIRT